MFGVRIADHRQRDLGGPFSLEIGLAVDEGRQFAEDPFAIADMGAQNGMLRLQPGEGFAQQRRIEAAAEVQHRHGDEAAEGVQVVEQPLLFAQGAGFTQATTLRR